MQEPFPYTQEVIDRLFQASEFNPRVHVYAVLDAARDEAVYPALTESRARRYCLMGDEAAPVLQRAAPHLVRLERDMDLTRFLVEQGWGNSWGVYLTARGAMDTLREHLEDMLDVVTEDGERVFFRFYDPRVLRVYLPTCEDEANLRSVFGPVGRFYMEGENPETILEFKRRVLQPAEGVPARYVLMQSDHSLPEQAEYWTRRSEQARGEAR